MDRHLSRHLHEKTVNAVIGGVGMLNRPQPLKSLNSIEKIQPRMMVVLFNGNLSATIISYYSPTNVSEEMDLIAFYNELSSLVHSISKYNVLVIGGDMNNQIAKNKTTNSAYTTRQTETGNI